MARHPNILFVFSDQQRWDTVGCYGQSLDLTPTLDRLARQGVKFEHAFTCQPVCGPARACLQTGKYATQIDCHTNHRMLPLDEKTIAHHLSEAGYRVGYVGKWHLSSFGPKDGPDNFRDRAVPPERRGGYKDYWVASDTLEFTSHGHDGHMFDADMNKVEFPDGRFRADCVTDHALEFLKSDDGERPFFLFVSYIEPHHQNDHNKFEGPKGSKEQFGDYEVPGDLEGTEGDWRDNYPDYLGCVNSLDRNLKRMQDQLEKQGVLDDTVVIYTSDHGCHFRTRNKEYKRSCHDGSIRIPMIAKGPGFGGGRVMEQMTSLMDLPATVLDIAGIRKPAGMQGNSILGLVSGKDEKWPEEVFLQISESQVGRCIRTRKWKYSVCAPEKDGWKDSCSDLYVEEFLYSLEADPHERTNLVADEALAEVRSQLRKRLIQRMLEAGETAPEVIPATEYEAVK